MCDSKISSYSNAQPSQFQSSPVNESKSELKSDQLVDGRSFEKVNAPKIDQLPLSESQSDPKSGLGNLPVKIQDPPVHLAKQASYEALPDRQRMIEKCGRPKDDMLFGLIKMSTNYKSVLSHLDKVHGALCKPENTKIFDQINQFKTELNGLEQAVNQYSSGPKKQRFGTEMKELDNRIKDEQNTLKKLEGIKNWPIGITLNEAINYVKHGIDSDNFKFFKECILYPQAGSSPVNYIKGDQNQLYQPIRKQEEASNLIKETLTSLESLEKNAEDYKKLDSFNKLDGKTINRQELNNKINQFKEDITVQKEVLKKLGEQTKDWPAGLSLKEAISYAEEGFSLAEAKILKNQSVNPKDLQKIVKIINDESKSIINQLSPDKIVASICADAQKFRADLRKNDGLSEENIAKLLSQADYAVKQYVDIFQKSGKIPTDFEKMTHAQLENNINKLPQAELSKQDRELAAKLMDLINENTSLIHLKYQGFDKKFTTPNDLIEKIYGGKIELNDLKKNQQNAKNFVEDQLKNVGKKLDYLITDKKLGDSKNIEITIKDYFIGFLEDRIDIQVCFGIINQDQTKRTLGQCLGEIKSLTDQQRSNLSEDLLGKIGKFVPKNEEIKVQKQIGSGSQGLTFAGNYKDETIIMKAFQEDFNSVQKGWEDAIKESLIMAEFKENPYIPKIIGLNLNEQLKKIIMEKIDGPNYQKLNENLTDINNHVDLNKKIMISVHCITGIVKGLEFMHSQNLVHCDLKLPNMMLDPKTLEPRLIDFGVCEKTGYNNNQVGTATTMSPEVINNSGVQPASDIYALGCIMYEQITGKPALKIKQIDGKEVSTRPDCTENLWEGSLELGYCRMFIQSCMQPNPKDRPTSQQILQAVRGEEITPATEGQPGLHEERLHYLDILKPENGYALNAKHLLAENKKLLA